MEESTDISNRGRRLTEELELLRPSTGLSLKEEPQFSVARVYEVGYTATLVACGWAGAVMDKVTTVFGKEQ